jgi:alkyldihydroxyacetonephosphate synthase
LSRALQKLFVTRVKGIDLEELVACTLMYEGDKREQQGLQSRVREAAKRHGGFSGGGAAGKDGYNLTFGIAYIRDFLLQYWTLGDSFETSVPFNRVDAVIAAVKEAVSSAHSRQKIAGHPFVTARVSQIYPSGCCVYFYIGFHYKGLRDPLAAFRDVEHAARVAIVENGGALSHHHGIGKLRAPYLDRIKSPQALVWIDETQRVLDPDGLFRNGNQGLGGDSFEKSFPEDSA